MFGNWEVNYNHEKRTLRIVHNGNPLRNWEDLENDDWSTIICNDMELDVNFYIEDGKWIVNLYPLKWVNDLWQTDFDIQFTIGEGEVK